MACDDESEDEDPKEQWDFDKPPKVISREEWEALPPLHTDPLKLPVKHVRFTHTGTKQCVEKDDCFAIIQKLQRDHMKKEQLPDIKYNFLVGGDMAYIFEGRGWLTDASRPAELDERKGDCIDIAFIGDYTLECLPFNVETSGKSIIKMGQSYGFIVLDKEPVIIPLRERETWCAFTMPDYPDPDKDYDVD